MDHKDIEHMKSEPGLHKVRLENSDQILLVASVNGELFGLSPDNKLSDEGWHTDTRWAGCVMNGELFNHANLG